VTPLRPRFTAIPPVKTDDLASERYVLSCAAVAASSQLLVAAHAAVGPPSDGPGEIALRTAVAQARTAAGAMCVVAGRFLTRVRQDEAALLPDLPSPVRNESGVTTPGLLIETDRRSTTRALQGATAECMAAAASLTRCDAPQDLRRPTTELVRIGDLMLAAFVDKD
jgi:hypothetical protein